MRYLGGPNIRFKNYGLALCAILILILFISIGSAANIAVDGNKIIGTDFPMNKELKVTAITEKNKVATDGKYLFPEYNMKVKDEKNTFRITANGVKTLKIKVKPNYSIIGLLSMTKTYSATNNEVTISYTNVPVLKYKVIISGKSESSSNKVLLKIQEDFSVSTNGKGKFTYNFNGIPAGKYEILIDGISYGKLKITENTIT